uniref:Uncharacterized protein n=1 Tax=Anguilla anguilla TaxID=7936 RepID=A0A0E9WKL1_ANGAN
MCECGVLRYISFILSAFTDVSTLSNVPSFFFSLSSMKMSFKIPNQCNKFKRFNLFLTNFAFFFFH